MFRMKLRLLLFTFLILLLFSTSWLLSKNLINHIPVMHAVGLRLGATTFSLWLFVVFCDRTAFTYSPLPSRFVSFFILSILGFSLYFFCSFSALKSLEASDLIMVLATIPAMTYLLGMLSRKLSFSWLKLSGVLIVSTAALAFNTHAPKGGDISLIGLLLGLVAATSYSLYGLLSKNYLSDFPLMISLAWITLISAITFVPVFILDPVPLSLISVDDVFKVLLLGTVCSAPVYVLYQKLLIDGGVLYANSIGLLAPFGVATGEWLIGDGMAFGAVKITAMFAAMVGIFLLLIDASRAASELKKLQAVRFFSDKEIT